MTRYDWRREDEIDKARNLEILHRAMAEADPYRSCEAEVMELLHERETAATVAAIALRVAGKFGGRRVAMHVEYVDINELRAIGWNPSEREKHKAIADLLESIKLLGINQPVIVTTDLIVIDGHRRLACARALGLTTVPVIRRANVDPKELYLALNNSARKLSNREWLDVQLHGGAIPKRVQSRLAKLEAIGGRELLERIRQLNLSPTMIDVAASVMTHIGCDHADIAMYRRVIEWIISGRRQWQARNAIKYSTRISQTALYDAIMANRDIEFTFR